MLSSRLQRFIPLTNVATYNVQNLACGRAEEVNEAMKYCEAALLQGTQRRMLRGQQGIPKSLLRSTCASTLANARALSPTGRQELRSW